VQIVGLLICIYRYVILQCEGIFFNSQLGLLLLTDSELCADMKCYKMLSFLCTPQLSSRTERSLWKNEEGKRREIVEGRLFVYEWM